MRLPDDHPIKRLLAQDQVPTPDQAQVNAQLREYLTRRGRTVADGLDLGHVQDHHLAQLGRLDVLAQHPGLHPDLALHLEMIADQRDHGARAWHNPYAQDPELELTSAIDQGQLDHQQREQPGTQQSNQRSRP
jgi:hypothetical protein